MRGRVQFIPVCCVFADRGRLPVRDVDPLGEGHAARHFGLRCDWTGNVGNYGAHLDRQCQVAAKMRELQIAEELHELQVNAAARGLDAAQRQPQRPPHQGAFGAPPDAAFRAAQQAAMAQGRPPDAAARGMPGHSGYGGGPPLQCGPGPPYPGADPRLADPRIAAAALRAQQEAAALAAATARAQAAAPAVAANASVPSAPQAGLQSRPHGPAGAPGSPNGDPGGTLRVALRAYRPDGGSDGEQLPLSVGDRVVVYHHEGRGWAYGARLRDDGNLQDGPRGWFPAWVFEAA